MNVAEELENLADLYSRGVLNLEEYTAAKAGVISRPVTPAAGRTEGATFDADEIPPGAVTVGELQQQMMMAQQAMQVVQQGFTGLTDALGRAGDRMSRAMDPACCCPRCGVYCRCHR
jgi:hypothetical protein